jgi:hypothetical protein
MDTVTSWEFSASGPIGAELSVPAGTMNVTAAPGQAVTVSLLPQREGDEGAERLIADSEVSFDGGRLTVEVPKRIRLRGGAPLDLVIGLPEGSSVAVSTASADVTCTGLLGRLEGNTVSGDVQAGQVSGPVSVNTASGGVHLLHAAAGVSVNTASGDVSIEAIDGDLTVKTASGDLRVGRAGGSAEVKTASGDVRVQSIAAGRGDVSSVSGDVTLAVPPGTGVYLDLSSTSGRVRSELDSDGDYGGDDPDLVLRCSTVSGDIHVSRAAPSA